MKIKSTPPSRANKKQISAHLSAALADAMKVYCYKNDFNFQELIAMSINNRVSELSNGERGPFLQVARQRIFRRKKSPAKVQTLGPDCRSGTKRVATFYFTKDVDRVHSFSYEYGVSVEELVRSGVAKTIGFKED